MSQRRNHKEITNWKIFWADNKDSTHSNLWNISQVAFREKSVLLNAYIRKEEKLKNQLLSFPSQEAKKYTKLNLKKAERNK